MNSTTFRPSFAERTLDQAIAERVVYPLASEMQRVSLQKENQWVYDAYVVVQSGLVERCQGDPLHWPFEVVLQISNLMQLDKSWANAHVSGMARWDWLNEFRPRHVRYIRELCTKHCLTRDLVGAIIIVCLLGLPHIYFAGSQSRAREEYLYGLYARIKAGRLAAAELGPWYAELTAK